ncbi:MAG: alcohol dehydrogenase catalytic domain-containing protein [Desulfamplus sp.]|nr:alcohol dehydrogenase catalytic domain-containing protein [Desulfamplus sp.]
MKIVMNRLKQLEIINQDSLIQNIPEGYVKVGVLYCGVCRTDAKMWDQGHRDLVLPRILGHEMVVRDTHGNRFMVWPGTNCTTCRHCRRGLENLCENMKIMGFHLDGGFASHMVVPSPNLIPLPTGLESPTACFGEPMGCIVNAFEKIQYEKKSRLLIYGGGTMGLATALYAKSMGLQPLIIEKNESKIHHVRPFLDAAGICCKKGTRESGFDLVINACPDVNAFCQAISKVARAGWIVFFSGIAKNEAIDTNILNLIHYKEVKIAGAYGMTLTHMEKAIPFMISHQSYLKLLIQDIVPPPSLPALMPQVLSGKGLKYILDFTLASRSP